MKLERRKVIFNILSYSLSIASMAIVFSLMSRVANGDLTSASIFLGIALLCEAGYNFILFFKYESKKDRIRISIVAALFIIAAILGFISNEKNSIFFSISSFTFIIALAINRILSINKDKKTRWNITNFLGFITLSLFSFSLLTDLNDETIKGIIILIALILLFMSFKKLILPTFNFEKVKILINILNITHTLDVIICLVALMISFSFIFPLVEMRITNFWDALWYCFAVITTIGFGDFAAETAIGRILTVILGLYGIVIVAILTSVIVNFYTAVTDKSSEKELNKIVDEVVEKHEEQNQVNKPKRRVKK